MASFLPLFLEFLYCKRQIAPKRLLDVMKANQNTLMLSSSLRAQSFWKVVRKFPEVSVYTVTLSTCPLKTTTGAWLLLTAWSWVRGSFLSHASTQVLVLQPKSGMVLRVQGAATPPKDTVNVAQPSLRGAKSGCSSCLWGRQTVLTCTWRFTLWAIATAATNHK